MISVPFGGLWSDCFYYSVTNKHLPYAGNTQSTVSFGAQSGKVGSKEEVTSLSAAVFLILDLFARYCYHNDHYN